MHIHMKQKLKALFSIQSKHADHLHVTLKGDKRSPWRPAPNGSSPQDVIVEGLVTIQLQLLLHNKKKNQTQNFPVTASVPTAELTFCPSTVGSELVFRQNRWHCSMGFLTWSHLAGTNGASVLPQGPHLPVPLETTFMETVSSTGWSRRTKAVKPSCQVHTGWIIPTGVGL